MASHLLALGQRAPQLCETLSLRSGEPNAACLLRDRQVFADPVWAKPAQADDFDFVDPRER